MHGMGVILAYLSPETVLPVTSVFATIVGVVLMFGRNAFRLAVRWVRIVTIRRGRGRGFKGPHFGPRDRVKDRARDARR